MTNTIETQLNPLEVKALEELKKVDHDSIWGLAVKSVMKQNDPIPFRRLISELKSQANDNAQVMKNILGDAFEPVIAL